VEKDGFETVTRQFTYRKGKELALKVTLVPKPECELILDISQPGAKVSIDGRAIDVRVAGEGRPITVPVKVGSRSQGG
jgi:hypothetical protein